MKKRFVVAAVVATALFFSVGRQAHAQSPADRETARHLMDEGDRFVEQQRFEDALKAYEGAHAIMHVPTTGIDVALTLTTLGRIVEAREVALEVTRMPGAGSESKLFAEARRDANELADRLAPKIPTLRLELPPGVDPQTVHASIDGEELQPKALGVPRRLNAGKHNVRVEAPGHFPFVRDVELKESARAIVMVDFRLGSGSGSSSREDKRSGNEILGLPPLAFAGLSASAVGLTLGAITGLVSLDKASEAKAACGSDPKNCDPAAESAIDTSKTLGWVSTASFAIAIAGGAIATYALVVKHSDNNNNNKTGSQPARSVGVHVSATGALIKGTF